MEVGCFIIRDTVAPADEHDALPFEGQGAHSGGMLFAFGDLFLDEELSLCAVQDRLVGILEEALVNEVGSAPTAMNPMLVFAAALGDRSNATGAQLIGSINAADPFSPNSVAIPRSVITNLLLGFLRGKNVAAHTGIEPASCIS
jgi:hypothetical protein